MLKKLSLNQFKNFKDAELELGAFTLLVGTNASGKSNIRDAFRFLHGISRGYNLPEIFGEKYIESGVLQWRGIRGGTREVTFQGESTFTLEVSFLIKDGQQERDANYKVEVEPGIDIKLPRVITEQLNVPKINKFVFTRERWAGLKVEQEVIRDVTLLNQRLVLKDLLEWHPIKNGVKSLIEQSISALSSMRFLDLNPDAMRIPSFPGQTILGDRGENLSSVLQAICEDPERKQTLLQWVRELTPMDAKDFEFPSDFTGKILLTLVEENGQKISAYSASDGTLRFLGIIAALLGPEPARFYFIEELENGIHPTRLHLLLELIERQVYSRNIQIVATTHSPQMLRLLSPKSLQDASLIYRLPDRQDAHIKRILDIPEAQRVIQEQDLANLHESGWLEDMVYFLEDEETVE
jgi:predicted ATPase